MSKTLGIGEATQPSPCLIAPAEAGCHTASSSERGPLPGMHVGSQLRLIRALGQGGMGSVWLAEHVALRTHVAVKFLRDMYMDHPLAIVRLHREAEAAARIQSPHVVRVFDVSFTAQGVPYIVMEHLEGQTLQDLVERRRRLSLEETVSILRQLCAALARAHEAGIVHRDIKPENIFLVEGEREPFVKVLDFGIAKDTADEAERLTVTGAILGTPHFMSPEQMAGGARVGPHSDLWALGVVAYFCLTGQIPFGGATVAAVAVAIDRGPPPPPSRLAPEVPPAIDAWVLSLLEPDPARRARSARAVLDALDAAVAAPRGTRPAQTEVMPPRESLCSGEGFSSLVTTLMPFGTLGVSLPRQRARTRTWALAAGAVMGLSTLAWAGASGVTRTAPAAQSASLAMVAGAAAGRAAPAVEPAAQCATIGQQPEAQAAATAPQVEAHAAATAPQVEAHAAATAQADVRPPQAEARASATAQPAVRAVADAGVPAVSGAQNAPTPALAAPTATPGKTVATRTRWRRDLGF
ncbi:serine/threonine-protein kinase [Sorangium atrum]|uniref:Protein kinase n=1 Tax=Sorangium atrum TaxID=2995308 RepID=A0ABT5BWA1_9BACT|nr:serine/threonine-protein kinase [Sorangium aterium]MDC0678455.1 protein kinase [Sorangium aterium]